MSVKENAKNVDTWLRGLFIIIFGVIFYVLYFVIWVLVVFQFLTKVVTGELNKNLGQLSESLTSFAFQILLYITFQSEERPFPFSPWPKNEHGALPEPEQDDSSAEADTTDEEKTD
jgi:hypothetical protein